MKTKSFWISVGIVWFTMVATDFLCHGIWLAPLYMETAHFWRTQDEMQKMLPLIWLSNFMFSSSFVWIYMQGVTKSDPWGQAFRYALAILLVSRFPEHMGMWATAPFPGELVMKWVFISTFQALLASWVVTFFLHKNPRTIKSRN